MRGGFEDELLRAGIDGRLRRVSLIRDITDERLDPYIAPLVRVADAEVEVGVGVDLVIESGQVGAVGGSHSGRVDRGDRLGAVMTRSPVESGEELRGLVSAGHDPVHGAGWHREHLAHAQVESHPRREWQLVAAQIHLQRAAGRTAPAAVSHDAAEVFGTLKQQRPGQVESPDRIVRAVQLQPHVSRLADVLIQGHRRARQVRIVRQTVGLARRVIGEECNTDQAAEDLVGITRVVCRRVQDQWTVRDPKDVLAA